ncbi:hypothetical protein GJ744_001014 [Endocarpon pusillum]|uniref:Uncharacterized protein n=1 Tax=Endocarpon pusillum TaxID=364733 RepID=A0A8H7ADX2_9EURO|nr:hypothetical protein GJ744_001014 [Endocarpon pusillum]
MQVVKDPGGRYWQRIIHQQLASQHTLAGAYEANGQIENDGITARAGDQDPGANTSGRIIHHD